MVPKSLSEKSFFLASGKLMISTAAIAAVVFLVASTGFSKTLEVNNQQIESFKLFLNTIKFVANYTFLPLTDEKIRAIFNTAIGAAGSGADISYGLTVLSAMNEFELVDLDRKTSCRERV